MTRIAIVDDPFGEDEKIDLRKHENAPVDLPHPFLRRITELVWDTEEVTQEQLDHVKLSLTTFAHLVWPGDVISKLYTTSNMQLSMQNAINYICTSIPKGSPITPPALRQGVIPTTPRA